MSKKKSFRESRKNDQVSELYFQKYVCKALEKIAILVVKTIQIYNDIFTNVYLSQEPQALLDSNSLQSLQSGDL